MNIRSHINLFEGFNDENIEYHVRKILSMIEVIFSAEQSKAAEITEIDDNTIGVHDFHLLRSVDNIEQYLVVQSVKVNVSEYLGRIDNFTRQFDRDYSDLNWNIVDRICMEINRYYFKTSQIGVYTEKGYIINRRDKKIANNKFVIVLLDPDFDQNEFVHRYGQYAAIPGNYYHALEITVEEWDEDPDRPGVKGRMPLDLD